MLRKKLPGLFGCVGMFVLALGQSGYAVVTSFTDIGSFNAAASTTLVEDFEAFSPKNMILASFVSNGNTYTGAPGPNVFVSGPGFTNYGLLGATTTSILTASGDEDYVVDFGSPSEAVGFDTYLNEFGPATVRVFGAANTLLDTINHTHDPTTIGFLGLVADEPIHSIRWTTVDGGIINTGIDNILQGDAIRVNNNNAIPEPASFALVMMGGFSLLRRRGA